MERARERIKQDLWDTDAWTTLIMEAQMKDISVARPIYEEFLKMFPTAARYWKFYIEHEIGAKNYHNAEKIIARCLVQCPNVDLWKTYLKYVMDVKGKLPNSKDEIVRAFEFALSHVGFDIASTQIWQDYLNLLKQQKTTSQFEEGQKIDALRKLYQRAIENPMHNLESVWKEYDAFENGLHKIIAKAVLTEHGPKYMSARAVYRERKNHMEGISRNVLARPPRGNAKDKHQAQLWKRLIEYEKTNPQTLEAPLLKDRVAFAFNQALLYLYHYPEIWYDSAMWQLENNDYDSAVAVLQKANIALADNLFLHYQLADLLESHSDIKRAKEVYENLLKKKSDTLIYVQYMRFARRQEGVDAARKVFFRARKSPNCTYHIYLAAAQMEYYINKDANVARKIYEMGFKKFSQETAFVFQYIDFLFHRSDENNLRVLFEKILATMPKEKTGEIWNMYLKFEYVCGNLNTIQKIEQRRAQSMPNFDTSGIFSAVQRYQFYDLWPCGSDEMASFVGGMKVERGGKKGKDGDHDKPMQVKIASAKYPMPDLSQLVLYKHDSAPGMNDMGPMGGISRFMMSLPTDHWDGPLVNVDQLMKLLMDTPVRPDLIAAPERKGRNRDGDESDDEDDGPGTTSTSTQRTGSRDVYRERMQHKFASTNRNT
jgi:cleavage stimulation factor subunit 3